MVVNIEQMFGSGGTTLLGRFGAVPDKEPTMPKASFETPDADEIEVDADDVFQISAGPEEGTTLIELEDGKEIVVVATQVEVAAGLGLNPLDYVDPEDDDESVEELVEDEEENEVDDPEA